jgi:cytochrome c553
MNLRVSAWAVMIALIASGCRRDMFRQPRSNPLAENNFFQDDAASRPLPPHTVARGFLEDDDAFYRGMIGTNLVTEFPFPVTRAVLERGRERFEIYCAECHGRTGEGNGFIVQRGFPAPPSYHIERLRAAPVGHFFNVITRGYGVMYSFASRVEPADRWAIVAYIRALQFSQDAALSDVPDDQRRRLKAAP